MPKRRQSTLTTWRNRLLLGVCGGVLVFIFVGTFAAAVAQSIVGPGHPRLGAAIAWTVIVLIALGAFTTWRLWNARCRSKYQRLPELLALTPQQFEQTVGAIRGAFAVWAELVP
jgi:uncharacterized membrane protein